MPRAFVLLWLLVFLGPLLIRAQAPPAAPASAPDWTGLRNFAIQLQGGNPEAFAKSRFQMIVMDLSHDGTDETTYSAEEVGRVRSGEAGSGAKKVIGYLSTGEAENYRSYWKPEWNQHPPPWMGPEDPEWKGDFKVRFWDPAWPALLRKSIDKMIDLGYDGAFLDVVDAGEFWDQEVPEADRNPDAERQMVELVKSLADYAHRRNPHFGILPNGAPALGRFPDYVKTVDGLFIEDVWYNGNKPNRPDDISETLSDLQPFQAAHKPIFVIDYPKNKDYIDRFYAEATAAGFIPYASVRQLDRLVVNPGHEP